MSARVASVIIRYNPPPGFDDRVARAAEQSALTVVVDNASDTRWSPEALRARGVSELHALDNARNEGIAAATNRGIAHARALGATHAFLLDHDSVPQPGAVDRLLAAAEDPRHAPVAAAVPRIVYGHPDIACRWPASRGGRSPFFRFVYADRIDTPTRVDLAISSGMLVPIAAWSALGGFDERLFIDLVDTDFCLRARADGHAIVAVPDATLGHALGEVEQRRLPGGVRAYPTHHGALRHYFISRNRIILARRHAVRFPAWMAYESLGGLKLLIKVAAFERQRLEKLGSMLRGTRDGLRGRTGGG